MSDPISRVGGRALCASPNPYRVPLKDKPSSVTLSPTLACFFAMAGRGMDAITHQAYRGVAFCSREGIMTLLAEAYDINPYRDGL